MAAEVAVFDRPLPAPQGLERTPSALHLPDDLSFEQWSALGPPLLEAAYSVMWWVGDWLVYGDRYNDVDYHTAAAITGLEYGTLADYKWVAAHVPPDVRRPALSFSHHRAVAGLPESDQRELLSLADESEWSRNEFRDRVNQRRAARNSSPNGDSGGVEVRVSCTLTVSAPATHRDLLNEVMEETAAKLRVRLSNDGLDTDVGIRTA